MKTKDKSGNLIPSESANVGVFSFDEAFDSSLVANRGEGVDALSVDDFVEKEFDKKHQLLSGEDMAEIAKQSDEAKKAAELYAQLTDKEETESSLIKSEDADNIDDIYNLYDSEQNIEIEPTSEIDDLDSEIETDAEADDNNEKQDSNNYDFSDESADLYDIEDFESIKHLLTDEEIEQYEKKHKPRTQITYDSHDKIKKQSEFEKSLFDSLYSDEYKESDEYKDMIFLEKQFDPLVKAPLIEFKKNASIISNLLEHDIVKQNKKFVEITEAPSINEEVYNDEKEHKTSSVEITRDENGEIENIVVVCKCGEKTLIKFDYSDENEEDKADENKISDFYEDVHNLENSSTENESDINQAEEIESVENDESEENTKIHHFDTDEDDDYNNPNPEESDYETDEDDEEQI